MFNSGMALRSGRKALQCPQVVVMWTKTASTAAASEESANSKMRLKAEFSKSFVQNIFRGIVEPAQAFPYPRVIKLEDGFAQCC